MENLPSSHMNEHGLPFVMASTLDGSYALRGGMLVKIIVASGQSTTQNAIYSDDGGARPGN